MSTEKWFIAFICIAHLIAAPAVFSGANENNTDPVVQFYRQRAASVFETRNPISHGVSYSFEAKAFYKKIDGNGRVADTDSAVATYYFSYGTLDSQNTEVITSENLKQIDFSFPNVFAQEYLFSFYPNDTGGPDLAIGFDLDSATDQRPVGLAIVDRDDYHLRWLYLYYPHEEGHKRFSRSFRMNLHDAFVFPDSMWVVGAKAGILSTDDYRLEVDIRNLQIYR